MSDDPLPCFAVRSDSVLAGDMYCYWTTGVGAVFYLVMGSSSQGYSVSYQLDVRVRPQEFLNF